MKTLKILLIGLLLYGCESSIQTPNYDIVQTITICDESNKTDRKINAIAKSLDELARVIDDTNVCYHLSTTIFLDDNKYVIEDNGNEETIAKLKCKRYNDAIRSISGLTRLMNLNCNK